MKKRFLLATILAIMSAVFCVQPTQAMTVDENGERWWTADELIPVAQEINDAIENICGKDYDCLWEETFKLTESDGKYRAADLLNEIMMMLTEVKPSQNTFKVLFNNEDRMLKWMGETIKKQDLSQFLVVWKVEENKQNFNEIIWKGEEFNSDWHQVYDINKDSAVIKAGTEVELTGLPTADLSENKSGIFYYTAVAGMSNAIGVLDYSSCLKSPNYRDGMGCKLKISETSKRIFEPYDIVEGTSESTEDISEESGKTSEAKENISKDGAELSYSWVKVDNNHSANQIARKTATTSSANPDVANSTDGQNLIFTDAKSASTESSTSQRNTDDIEIPNSGNISKKENTFPWWIIILILGCMAILVWLFWPKHEKESKKF